MIQTAEFPKRGVRLADTTDAVVYVPQRINLLQVFPFRCFFRQVLILFTLHRRGHSRRGLEQGSQAQGHRAVLSPKVLPVSVKTVYAALPDLRGASGAGVARD